MEGPTPHSGLRNGGCRGDGGKGPGPLGVLLALSRRWVGDLLEITSPEVGTERREVTTHRVTGGLS